MFRDRQDGLVTGTVQPAELTKYSLIGETPCNSQIKMLENWNFVGQQMGHFGVLVITLLIEQTASFVLQR